MRLVFTDKNVKAVGDNTDDYKEIIAFADYTCSGYINTFTMPVYRKTGLKLNEMVSADEYFPECKANRPCTVVETLAMRVS